MVTVLVEFVDLLTHLRDRGVPHQGEVATRSIEMPCTALPHSEVTYVRWEGRLPYLQIIQPIVRDVPPARFGAVERALININHAHPIAGFGLETERRFIYTRRTLAVYEDGILASWFDRELAAVMKLVGEQYASLKAVVDDKPATT